jgi:hypothetical protein
MLLGRIEAAPEIPCATCDIYHTMERHKAWLVRRPLLSPSHVLDRIRSSTERRRAEG